MTPPVDTNRPEQGARALIVVDVQNDFCPGGSLAVDGGETIASRISEWIAAEASSYDVVVATADWHPAAGTGISFDHFSDHPDYVDTWPPHCVQDTPGADFHPRLVLPERTVVVRKGQRAAAYSGFEGHDRQGRRLADILREAGVDRVDVVGLATDHCVRATALDAADLGLRVRVLESLTAGVAPESTELAVRTMQDAGITVSG